MVEETVQMCIVCAWRENCQKKFSVSKDLHFRCPDYSRDVGLKPPPKLDSEPEPKPKK